MSGPKIGTIQFDISEVNRLDRELERMEAEEIKRLESAENSDAVERRRKEILAKRKQRRTERQKRKQLKQRRRKEEQRTAALVAFRAVKNQLEKAVESTRQLSTRFPDMVFPDSPKLIDENGLTDAEAIQDATFTLREVAASYQKSIDTLLLAFHQKAAAERSTQSINEWINSFSVRASRRTADIVSALESDTIFIGDRQRQVRLEQVRLNASEVIKGGGLKDEDLSQEVLVVLDKIFEADDEQEAALALERLKASMDKIRQREEFEKNEKEKVAKRERVALVAEHISDALEDLGFEVSGVEETVFSKDGHLYAWDNEWKEHVLRFEFDQTGQQVRAVPLRIADEDEKIAAADAQRMADQDKRFDEAWCSTEGMVPKARKKMESRGVGLSFKAQHRPGELPLERVAGEKLGKRLKKKISAKRDVAEQRLREREHK